MLFLVFSTNLIPKYPVAKYEAKTSICSSTTLNKNETYYLHLLGAGYSLDSRLPVASQCNTTTLARLIEAIRISKCLPHYKIITSEYSQLSLESQAEVAKIAAIALGIPAQNCEILPTRSNTAEEVNAFVVKLGTTKKKVIVVSDALHLFSAMGHPRNI